MTRADLRAGLYASCLVILVVGLGGAAWIYRTAEDESNAAIDEMTGSKVYVRELQRFGGKAAVLFDELNRWFAGLWQGKSLGITLACISVFASLVLLLIASRLRDEKN
jgi:hypothetical protein